MDEKDCVICTSVDQHIKSLIRNVEILWKVTLNDGTVVYSDFYRPKIDLAPWLRLKNHCIKTNTFVIKVECIMLGVDPLVMFEDENGLDGILILRGSSKDITINDDGDPGIAYKHLIVGVLRADNDIIDVRKFSWPENVLEPFEQTRKLTIDNLKLMIFKNEQRREQLSKTLENIQVS
jgi:hypothetical protein